ncbi:MAG: N-6 DNA methylase [Candidatus Nitrotoga sp.]|nr:N-6 DNA methylase [Candidatus Nitrotoga sp.]MDP1854925.1 N-6 DNA methylase [Candidatus Nitrotoga sp.]
MLDTDTKRRIDTARDILVGKVPDPKSQVEQITIALIYKFMDDMDAEAEELGGKRKFFTGEFARYGWAKLMSKGLGGHELIALYGEGIGAMPENPGIPVLFRDIFKNAYLPYRDPETLKSFLKIINEFSYDHSERLGDAFEYLLSVLGSQGDAGQFRTPRHIIDFIVEILAPQKGETILDPACGTAGFLISAYKHILRSNSSPRPQAGESTSTPFALSQPTKGKSVMQASTGSARTGRIGDLLTPEEKGRLAQNFKGYDISPDMVRLSLVNLYLHGFTDPHIVEYDTLTSEERWNEYADVILANPPFMSPKGGIKPHKRFSIQAKRSEVLFVDYMAEHLTPTGRAGIIVPEGIIFQSQTAYKALRKMLVENSLVAVISLPAGCFNPYSGVKTSILILDKSIAKQSYSVAFFKVENDGYGLGAQRRANTGEQLTQVQAELAEYLQALRSRQPIDSLQPALGLIIAKEKIAANGDYNLSGERYREGDLRQSVFPLRRFEEVCTLEYGASLPKEKRVDGPFPVVGSNGVTGYHNEYLVAGPAIVVGRKGSAGEVTLIQENCFPIDTTYYVKQTKPAESDVTYLYWVLKTLNLPDLRGGAGIPGLNRTDVYETHQLPLPPLEVQKEIMAEIEGYQKVINGARAVLDHYRPHIPTHPDWPMVALGEIVSTGSGGTPSKQEPDFWIGNIPWVSPKDMKVDFLVDTEDHISEAAISSSATKLVPTGTLLCVVRSGILQHTFPVALTTRPMAFNQDIIAIQSDGDKLDIRYLFYIFNSKGNEILASGIKPGVTVQSFHSGFFKAYQLPLPDITTQQAIVAEIEAEQALVAANRELIARFEKKIQATLARIWGEDRDPANLPDG